MSVPTTTKVSRPRSQGYDIQIGSTLFRLAPSPDTPFTKGTAELETMTPDIVGAAQRGARGQAPSHHQEDFNGGEGLMHAYDIQNNRFDATRFWSSEDVAVDTSKEADSSVKVANTQDLVHSGGANYNSPDQAPMMVYADDSLFFVDDDQQTINRIDNPLTSTLINTENPHDGETASNIWGLAQEGGDVYAVLFNGHIHKRDADTDTWAHWLDFQTETGGKPHAIWSAKGRLLVGHDGELYEVTTSGTVSLLATAKDPGSGTSWTSVVDAGHAILAGNRNGNVYAFSGSEGDLALKNQTPFEGEEISGVGAAKGVVLVGTRYASPTGDVNRVYEAALGGDYTLRGLRTQGLQLLREWDNGDDELNEAPAFFVGSRDSLYFSVEEDVFDDGTANVYVWRYDIGTSGLFREWNPDDADGTRGLAAVENRLFELNQAGYLRRRSVEFEGDGFLITPLIDFGNREFKAWSRLLVEMTGVSDSSGSIDVYITDNPEALFDPNHADWDLLANLVQDDSRKVRELEVDDWVQLQRTSREIAFKFELNPNTGHTESYTLHSFTVEAEPWHVLSIPLLASDRIERPGRKPMISEGLGQEIYAWLRDRRGDGKTLVDLKTGEEYLGRITQVVAKEIGDKSRGGNTTVAQVQFRGVKK